MKRPSRSSALAAVCLSLAIGTASAWCQSPTCPGSGLDVAAGRLGDAWSLGLTGPPGAAAVLASDVSGGPVALPFGFVCVGLSPSLVTMPATLDAAGHLGLSGVLPLGPAFPAGSSLFTQAALAHPSLPGGFSITNGAAITFRPPRLALFRSTPLATTLFLIDALTDTVASSQVVPGWANGPALSVPRLGWLAWKTATNGIAFVDDFTGANALTILDAWSPGTPATMAVSNDGAFLFTSILGPGVPALTVKTYSLPSGGPVSTTAVPVNTYTSRGLYPIPGTPLVYVADVDRLHVVNGLSGALLTTITFPGNLAGYDDHFAFVSPGRIWVVVNGLLWGIDTATHAIVAGPAVLGTTAIPLSIGPGIAGPALWASSNNPATGNTLVQVSLATLAITSGAALPPAVIPKVFPSAGGTTMLIEPALGNIYLGATILEVNPLTQAATTILTGVVDFAVLRSNTLTKGYFYNTSLGLVSFQTDPFIAAGAIVPLPQAFVTQVRMISN